MNINKNNYEHFLMDYLDGKLTANEVSEVLLFLEQHPDIKAEFEGLQDVSLPVDADKERSFTHLKRPTYASIQQEYTQLLVAELEGDLTPDEMQKLNADKLLYPELLIDQKRFKQTIVSPDINIGYPDKQSLKRKQPFIVFRNTFIRVAAILLVAASVGWYISIHQVSAPEVSTVSLPQIDDSNDKPQRETNSTQRPLVTVIPDHISVPGISKSSAHHSQVASRAIQFVEIQHVAVNIPVKNDMPQSLPLSNTDGWMAYSHPTLPQGKEEYFPDIRVLAAKRIQDGIQQVGVRTASTIETLNKAAGVNVEKESSGKITKLEIAGLGFEWSRSK